VTLPEETSRHRTISGTLAVLVSLASQNIGAAFAKSLFPQVGPAGMTTLRISLSACLLLAIYRPWHSPPDRKHWVSLLGYGAMLGLMNTAFYQALARIPVGIASAIEVTGPLAIVLLSSRRSRDLVWFVIVAVGLYMLWPPGTHARLDPLGVAFAFGAAVCWALYIVFGKRVSNGLGGYAVAWGMTVAAFVTLPVAVSSVGTALISPTILMAGLAVAALSSALPFSLEMAAMRRLPAYVFSIILSSSPAVAALAGFAVLGERLTLLQWFAIACVVIASAGSAISSATRSQDPTIIPVQ
jgi:inner membrane transporter RhtA